MKFKINDEEYFVKWEYPISDSIPYKYITICKIYDGNTSYATPLVQGVALRQRKDNFCKNTGRKISLDRALQELFPNTLTMHDGLFPYQCRAIAWAEYFKESSKRKGEKHTISVQDITTFLEGISRLPPFNDRERAKLEFCNSLLNHIKNNKFN